MNSMQLFAQTPQLPNNMTPIDTSLRKTNTSDWHNETSRTTYRYLDLEKEYEPDTSLHTWHRRPFSQPWYRDLGNAGTASRNLLFMPENRVGPTLGYYVYDVYKFQIDSLKYFETNKPYTVFSYGLGSKLEQVAGLMHTQNIKPNWNFAAEYRKVNSPGYYAIQRTNNDNASLTTHYHGKRLHYELFGALVYNHEQQDENGGISYDSTLKDGEHNDRGTIPVVFENPGFNNSSGSSVPRSSVTNTQRDFAVMLQHAYTIGKTDTVYSKDSTSYHLELTPRFSIKHRLDISSEKYQYKDLTPDSLRYAPFFSHGFPTADSVYTRQKWVSVNNCFSLNGFLGKREKQLAFSAGIGNRVDQFTSEFIIDKNKEKIVSNYIIGNLKKEALHAGEWFYNAHAQFYITGDAAGSSVLQAAIGKDLGKQWGVITAGFKQELGVAPYNYTTHYNQFDTMLASFNKESITQIFGSVQSGKLGINAGVRNYLVNNYMYLNAKQLPDQYVSAFNITQIWLQKTFRWKSVVLDNELAYQQLSAGSPVNVPVFMGRHQLSLERYIFGRALKIATGLEVRYHSTYEPAAYSPLFNRFYYQNTYTVSNTPEGSVFFNFKIRSFRAYVMGDQLQRLFADNIITAPGYPGQDFMLRFGFSWVMVN